MNRPMHPRAEREAMKAAIALGGEPMVADVPKPEIEAAGFTIADPPPETPDEVVARLAKLAPRDYETRRAAEAKALGWRAGLLDREVAIARGDRDDGLQGRALEIPDPDPWPEAVDGAALLLDLAEYFRAHAVLPPGADRLLALWTLQTYVATAFLTVPYLHLTSPEKGSGKSTLLDLLAHVVARPLNAASATGAAIYRAIAMARPTLLIDEADRFVANEDLVGILNAGYRQGSGALRCVGDDQKPRLFDVFGPKAIAGIGSLPDTIADRSLSITMKRAMADETPTPIGRRTRDAAKVLSSRCARWAADNRDALDDADPVMPPGVVNRSADKWRALVAIAVHSGGAWPEHVVALATKTADDDDNRGVVEMLLADVRAIFREKGAERLATETLVAELVEMSDRPWPELPGSGKPITAAWFTRRVKPLGVRRQQWRVPGSDDRPWGFYLDHFTDAFARYLPTPPAKTGDVVTSHGKPGFPGNSEVETGKPRHHFENGANPQKSANVTTSPLSEGGLGEGVPFDADFDGPEAPL